MVLASGCAMLKSGYRNVKDYSEQMELLKTNFPEIYELYRQGEVIIDQVYEYRDKNGTPKVHVKYHLRSRGVYY